MRKIIPFLTVLVVWCVMACSQKKDQPLQDEVTVVEQTGDDTESSVQEEQQSPYYEGEIGDVNSPHERIHSSEEQRMDDEASATTDLLAVKGGQHGRFLQREGYVTLYNTEWRIPNWVAWSLTRDHASGPYKRKGMAYHEDTEVTEPRATLDDYRGSHYSRGHMCPSGDNKWDAKAQDQSFLLTNMCPQDRTLNGGDWNELEMRCRRWAERYGEVYIVAGPIVSKSNPETIGRNHVVVPDKFFKVVLCTEGTPRALGFIYNNRQDHHKKMREYVVSVDEVERITGLDFFAALPDDIEQRIEAHSDLDDWK